MLISGITLSDQGRQPSPTDLPCTMYTVRTITTLFSEKYVQLTMYHHFACLTYKYAIFLHNGVQYMKLPILHTFCFCFIFWCSTRYHIITNYNIHVVIGLPSWCLQLLCPAELITPRLMDITAAGITISSAWSQMRGGASSSISSTEVRPVEM